MDAVTLTVSTLSDADAALIVATLTKAGSEFQMEVMNRKVNPSTTPIAIVRSGGERIASWSATHQWRGMQTLEGFTNGHYRRRGLARLGAALLVADGLINTSSTVAVFSPYCIEIARSVGCRDVRLYERRGDDWVENS